MTENNPKGQSSKQARRAEGDSLSYWDKNMIDTMEERVQGSTGIDPEKVRLDQIEICLAGGANINVRDENGDTVLHMAIKMGCQKVVEYLLRKGAKTAIPNNHGQTAFTLAENLGNQMISIMLKRVNDQRGEPTTSTPVETANPDSNRDRVASGSKRKSNMEVFEANIKRQFTLPLNLPSTSHPGRNTQHTVRGLTQSAHGFANQIKHLGFTQLCSGDLEDKKLTFHLSTERLDVGSLDDMVSRYTNNEGEDVGLFVQLKHSRTVNNSKVNAHDLFEKEDGDYFVPEYFISSRKIKENSLFSDIVSKNFILGTTKELDLAALKKARMSYEIIDMPVKCLEMIATNQNTRCYKLTANVKLNPKVYEKLRKTSDARMLARQLVESIFEKKKLTLVGMFKQFHVPLVDQIIDPKSKRMRSSFLKNREDPASATTKFQQIVFEEVAKYAEKKLPRQEAAETVLLKRLGTIPLDLSENFGKEILGSHQSTELPVDDISEKDIDDFLNNFYLVTKLPDEDEVGKMITRKIGKDSKFNLLDATVLGRYYMMAIIDWFKGQGKRAGDGKYLTYEGCEAFFEKMENEIYKFTTMGVTSVYCEELKDYDMHFVSENQHLKTFFAGDESSSTPHQILIFVAHKETLLTTLKVHGALVSTQNTNDSYIFIHLRSLLRQGIKDQVLGAFKSEGCFHFLVIEHDSDAIDQNEKDLLSSLVQDVENMKNVRKKMIIVARGNEDYFNSMPRHIVAVRSDDVGFIDFTKDSRQKLLEKPIINFQTNVNQISIKLLLDIKDTYDLQENELKNLSNLIEPKILVQLIRDKEIEVGVSLEKSDGIGDCYIDRKFIRHVVIKEDILDRHEGPDLLVISGNAGELQRKQPREGIIILDGQREEEQFEAFCRKSKQNIHWLREVSGKYIWQRSKGDINYLLKYRDECESDRTDETIQYSEDEVAAYEKPVIISDTAGTGKSTTLNRLALKIKKSDLNQLVLKMNLSQCISALELMHELPTCNLQDSDADYAVDFVVMELLNHETDFFKAVFKFIIRQPHRVAMMFDSYDEISPSCANKVIGLLQTLSKQGIRRLFVATKSHARRTLEDKLNTFCHELQQFSSTNQGDFFSKFWESGYSDEKTENRKSKYVTSLVKKLPDWIKDPKNKFTGIPQHLKMVAVIFQSHSTEEERDFASLEEFIDSEDDQPKLPDRIDLIYLYKRFLEMTHKAYFEKANLVGQHPTVVLTRNLISSISTATHTEHAFKTLFENSDAEKLLRLQPKIKPLLELGKEQECYSVEQVGIITKFIDGKPQFAHRTYLEYFPAEPLCDTLKVANHNKTVRKIYVEQIFLQENYETLRAFMNCLLIDEYSKSFKGKSWKSYLIEHRNSGGLSIFHVAAREGNGQIMKLFLNSISKNLNDRRDVIELKDGEGRTAIYWAASHGNLKELKLLVERGGGEVNTLTGTDLRSALHIASANGKLNVVKYLLNMNAKLDSLDNAKNSPLHRAAGKGQLDVVKYLLGKNADVHCKNAGGSTPLHVAVYISRFDVMECLLEHGADINAQDENGNTPLFSFICMNKLEGVEYLLKKNADVNIMNYDNFTTLHHAVFPGYLSIVKTLLSQTDVDVNAHDGNKSTALHYAVLAGHLNVVEYLIEKNAVINTHNEDGNTPLHAAAGMNKLDVLNCLLVNKADINCLNRTGNTPLHFAASVGHLDIAKHLIKNKAIVDCRDDQRLTPLHLAAHSGQLKLVDYLISENADVNLRSMEGFTPLHAAVAQGKLDATESLLGNDKTEVNIKNEKGNMPLHIAAALGHLDIAKHLIKNKAIVDCLDNQGRTPLHVAAHTGELELVKYLICEHADVNPRGINGATPLHAAVSQGKLDVTEFLLGNDKIQVNFQNEDGNTPLHIASSKGEFDMVKCLLGKKADVNLRNKDGQTALDAAISAGQSDVVKHLQENEHRC